MRDPISNCQSQRFFFSLNLHSITVLLLLLAAFCICPAGAQGSNRGKWHGRPAREITRKMRVPPQTEPATPLELGKSVERELAGGQEHKYQVTLAEGQYAKFIVELRGIDVLVRVLGPDGKQITEFDDELRPQAQEAPELVAGAAGRYEVVVVAKQRNTPATGYSIRWTEVRPATDNDRSIQEARALLGESFRLWRGGKYDAALAPATRAVELREKFLGPEHFLVGSALNNLGVIYYLKTDLDKSEALHQRALKIREKALGPDNPAVASSQNNIAEIYRLRGNYEGADPLYRRAIDIWERSLGRDHVAVALPLTNLAIVRRTLGDYTEAESLYLRALAIREKALGTENLEVATSLNNLGVLYWQKGDLDKAELHLQRALEIWEKVVGPEHPHVSAALNNLANIQHDRGDYGKAEQLFRRALKIIEKVFGPESSTFATTLDGLASVLSDKGELNATEPMLKRALEIREKTLGPGHIDIAASQANLGQLYARRGDFDKAEPLYQRALNIREKTFGPDHPEVSKLLSNMSALYVAIGDTERAITAQTRANAIAERNVGLNLATGSERQKLAYLATLLEITDRTISLHIRTAPDSSAAGALSATTILRRKGRVQDAMSDSLAGLRRRFNAQDEKLLDQLNETTARLSRLVFDGSQGKSLTDHQKRTAALEEQKEQIEDEISRRSAGFYERAEPVTLTAVQSAVPPGAALIEISSYRPFNPKGGSDHASAYGEPRYVAYVLRPEGEVRWKELGEATDIDRTVNSLRQALRDPKRGDVKQLARAVDEKVMRPLRALVGDATHIFISPDGDLNLLPFAALRDEQGRYLIETYSFTYVTSGRDLLRMQVARASKSKPLVVANPKFGEPSEGQLQSRRRTSTSRVGLRRSVTNTRELTDVYFAPLNGTALEASTIQTLFPEAKLLAGEYATETALKDVAAPKVLHVATHGFFLHDNEAHVSPKLQVATRGINTAAKIENPLLRSGLALAGANQRSANGDDGILTALEASGLNLWGTKLVVLSACDTGVGEVRNGEGVYGLRRAFVLAGAESLVMSLWPASDYTTRKLMTEYYKNLKQGMGRGAALRAVQLKMLKQNPKLHPFYWANFIHSGEWANLEGKR